MNVVYASDESSPSACCKPICAFPTSLSSFTMNVLDDLAVVTSFARGERLLVANQHLRVEPAFDSIQLLAKRGGLIGAIRYDEAVPTALARTGEYWNLVNQVLIENHFMPLGTDGAGFYQYRKTSIPAGYTMQFAPAKMLWRDWWRRNRHNIGSKIQMDMLVFVRNTWYPIREVTPNHEMLFVTTLVAEIQLDGKDLVVWLTRTANAPATSNAQATPSTLTNSSDRLSRVPVASGANTPPQTSPASAQKQPPHPAQLAQKPVPPYDVLPVSARSRTNSNPSDLKKVARLIDGKLYIKTAVGEIVVEGEGLKFWLTATSRSGIV